MKKNHSSKPKFCLILINSSSLNLINLKIMKIPPTEPVYLRKLKTLDGRFSCIILLNNQCQSKVFLRGLKYNYLPHTVNLLWDGKSTRTFKGWFIALAGTWTPVFTGTAHGRHPGKYLQHDEYLQCKAALPYCQLRSQLSTHLWSNHFSYKGASGIARKKSNVRRLRLKS